MSNIELSNMQLLVILIAVLWTLFWKGVALWHAARNRDNAWFIAMLLINTLGIIEVYYLFGVRKIKTSKLLRK